MHLTADIQDNQVCFRIINPDSKYIPVLRMCYYLEDEKGFYKVYPADYPYMDTIRRNFLRYGEAMFNQLGYFAPIPWEDGLLAFAERVAGKGIDWWLTGSCAVCVRGIQLLPHDVDIMVKSSDLPVLIELFREDIFEPIVDTGGWVAKDFGVLFLGCRVDIASDPSGRLDVPEPADCGPYAKDHLETVIWRGQQILIPPLELSIAVNRKRQRWERVKLMEEFQS
jgi:hypothetical protein